MYGEVQRAGAYRVERQMTVLQALSPWAAASASAAPSAHPHPPPRRGRRRARAHPQLNDWCRPDDVIVVREAFLIGRRNPHRASLNSGGTPGPPRELFAVWGGVVLLAWWWPRAAAPVRGLAEVVVGPRGGDPLVVHPGSGGSTPGFLAAQADIIASERVGAKGGGGLKVAQMPRWAEKLAKASGGQGDADRWIAGRLKKFVKVSPSHESNVLTVTFTGDDPKFAADYANALAKAYLETDLELKIEPARQSAAWFDEHTKALRATSKAPRPPVGVPAQPRPGGRREARSGERAPHRAVHPIHAAQAQSTETTSRQRQGRQS